MRFFLNRNFAVFTIMITLASVSTTAAQLELPRLSPHAKVVQTFGITEVKITYSRPGVKDRVIWGGLVPYNEMWRTGANEATTISFSTDVEVNGNKLEKGKYGLFTIPAEGEWTVIFNKEWEMDGTSRYKAENDALRIKVRPEEGEFKERMAFYFTDLMDESVKVVLHWEKLKVPFTVSANTSDLVIANAKSEIRWVEPYRAASYALENSQDMDLAKKWLDISMMIDKNYWNTSLKAQYLKKTGDSQAAVKTLETALEMGKEMEQQPFNYAEMQKRLEEWKKK